MNARCACATRATRCAGRRTQNGDHRDSGITSSISDRRRFRGRQIVLTGDVDGLRARHPPAGQHLDDSAHPEIRWYCQQVSSRGPWGHHEQSARRGRRYSARCADRPHRRRGIGQEFFDHRVGGWARAWCGRPDRDQGSRRSNPATYTGLLEPIRKASPRSMASNPHCSAPIPKGAPTTQRCVIYTDLAMMAGVASTCEEKEGVDSAQRSSTTPWR